ncbi:hypothetical protein ACS0TY_009813 [Phlomoides rotata]
MVKRTGAPGMIGFDGVRRRRGESSPGSWLTRGVNSIFTFVRFAKFEILFVLFVLITFIIFKYLVKFIHLSEYGYTPSVPTLYSYFSNWDVPTLYSHSKKEKFTQH